MAAKFSTAKRSNIVESWHNIDNKRGIWLYVSIVPSSLSTAISYFANTDHYSYGGPLYLSSRTLASWALAKRPIGYLAFHHEIVNYKCLEGKIKVVAHVLFFTGDSGVNFGTMPLQRGGESARLLCPLAVIPIDILSAEERASLGL